MKKLIVFAFFVCFLIFFPKILSTSLGKPLFTYFANKKLDGNTSIKELSLSWFGPQEFFDVHFASDDLTASIGTLKTSRPLWDLANLRQSFEIQDATVAFPAHGATVTSLQAQIQGHQIQASAQTSYGGHLQVQGFAVSKKNFDLKASIQNIPTILIDKILNLKGYFYSALGPTFSAQGDCFLKDEKGSANLNLQASNGSCTAALNIEDDLITLRSPLKAQAMLSSKLADLMSKKASNTLFTELVAKTPFILNISPNGFQCPLDFSFEKLQVKQATLDLGKVQVLAGESLLFLVKLFNEQSSKWVDLWFTPVSFSLEKKQLAMGRIDMLLSNSIHICAWGDINLAKDRLNMILGIPSNTLERSFQVRNLSSNYVLKIPVHGKISHPKFDTGPAVAKIAAMKAAEEIPSTGGKVFGGLIQLFTQTQDEEDVPKPNRPFPWER